MKKSAINIKELSKCFLVNDSNRYSRIKNIVSSNCNKDKFYALNSINLEIEQGELIGIIGPNGAGKSTLLKIIAEVTPPTKGKIEITGKVASILEIGVGFQPELSGYENIFLAGELYGLSKKEIKSKLNKIIDMFGFPDFMNTMVKHYSSGMYMRLAFSVIINIGADIYLFDEILSVGDAYFQAKAIKEIEKLKKKGATVCVVTHSPDSILNICDKMVLLNKGCLEFYGNPHKVLINYKKMLNSFNNENGASYSLNTNELQIKKNLQSNTEDFNFDITNLSIRNSKKYGGELNKDKNIEVNMKINYKSVIEFKIGLIIKDQYETVLITNSFDFNPHNTNIIEKLKFIIKKNTLNPSKYILDIYALSKDFDIICGYSNLIKFTIQDKSNNSNFNIEGYINIPIKMIRYE